MDFLDNLARRYGVPNRVVAGHGSQFASGAFRARCESLDIQLRNAPGRPQGRNQDEEEIEEELKDFKIRSFKCLKRSGKSWVSELPSVMWSSRTTVAGPASETPFALAYGPEAVLPGEERLKSPRVLPSTKTTSKISPNR